MMQRSLAELKNECSKLGLSVRQTGKREAKKDFVKSLQEYNLRGKRMTFGLKYRLSMETPQLCFLSTGLRSEEEARIFSSPDYVVEEKLNGIRMIMTYHPENGFEFFSRNLSVEDYIPVSYTDKIYMGEVDYRGLWSPFVLDTEIVSEDPRISTVIGKRGVVTETVLQAVAALLALNSEDSLRIQKELNRPLKLKVFDCLLVDEDDLRNRTYSERRQWLSTLLEKLKGMDLPVEKVKAVRDRKKEYLEHIWSMGGEGVVAKPIYMPYLDRESRPRDGWIKFKRTVSGAVGDSIDGFVTDFDLGEEGKGYENLIGSLTISVYLVSNGRVRTHEVAKVSNIPLELRKEITVYQDGEPVLHPDYYNKVVEIDGQSISARVMRLTHPRLIRFRTDKNPDQCIIEEESLRRLII